MAAVKFVEVRLEESPLNAQTWNLAAAPNRVATEKLYMAIRAARLSAAPAHLSRADELRGILGSVADLIDAYAPAGTLGERAYWKDLTWLLELSGFKGVATPGGALVTDGDQTTVVGVNGLNSTTVNVVDTSLFPTTGTFILAGATAVTYTGKTATSFTGCGSHPATTGGELVQGNVPATAVKWVFSKRDSIDAQTAQFKINYADTPTTGNLIQGNGFGVSELGLNAAGELTAELVGLYLQRLAVDTATAPAIVSGGTPPLRRGDLYLSWLTGGATPAGFEISIANGLDRYYGFSVLPSSPFPTELAHGEDQVRVTGSIPKRLLDDTDFDALLNASTFAAKGRWRSTKSILATAAKYTLWVDMPACQYLGGDGDEMGNKRRIGASYDFFAAIDETAGYDVRFTLVNDTATIATYA
jgi:hypothetical protein